MKRQTNRQQVKLHLTMPLLLAVTLYAAAFSTGSPVFLTPAILVTLLTLTGIFGVLHASRTLRISASSSADRVQRGDDATLSVEITCRSIIPLAPMWVELTGADAQSMQLTGRAKQTMSVPFHAAHVGAVAPGVRRVTMTDFFGICTVCQEPESAGKNLLVLPQLFDIDPLHLSAGETGTEAMARASEDVTNPTDVRSYQPGDPLKKIHWKLSARKQELLVRRFEDPVQPDLLVLMDSAVPKQPDNSEAEADLRDTLIETAASVMAEADKSEHPARLPLTGEHPVVLDKDMGLKRVLEGLAQADFAAPESFVRVMMIEMRRMRKVGCTVVITARLDSEMVEMMTAMRRMGPNMRLYLVTSMPDDPQMLPLVRKLQEVGVEVGYVKPLPM